MKNTTLHLRVDSIQDSDAGLDGLGGGEQDRLLLQVLDVPEARVVEELKKDELGRDARYPLVPLARRTAPTAAPTKVSTQERGRGRRFPREPPRTRPGNGMRPVPPSRQLSSVATRPGEGGERLDAQRSSRPRSRGRRRGSGLLPTPQWRRCARGGRKPGSGDFQAQVFRIGSSAGLETCTALEEVHSGGSLSWRRFVFLQDRVATLPVPTLVVFDTRKLYMDNSDRIGVILTTFRFCWARWFFISACLGFLLLQRLHLTLLARFRRNSVKDGESFLKKKRKMRMQRKAKLDTSV